MVGPLGDFTHTFELLEYKGPLNYTPGTNKVSGTLNLTQTGDLTSQLGGPIEFTKSPTNRFDELTLWHEVWTNTSSQTFLIISNDFYFERDTDLKTNYYGYVVFEDGDPNPNRSGTDYLYWILSIDDVNRIQLRGGSILRTSRTNPAKSEADMRNVLHCLHQLGV